MWYGPNVAVILIYLFYLVMYVYIDSHILRIRSDTVVVHRRLTMVPVINGSLTIPGDECGPKFPDICLTVEEKPRKISTRKLARLGIEPKLLHKRQQHFPSGFLEGWNDMTIFISLYFIVCLLFLDTDVVKTELF